MSQTAATTAGADTGRGLAFDSLYRENRDAVYAYAAGLMRDRTAAEDVAHLAFERAYRRRDRFDPTRGEPRAWLFGIARNAALDELRRRKREASLATDPADPGALEPASAAAPTELRLALAPALAALPGRDRDLVALKFFADLTNAEIAAVVGISESNVGTRLSRIVNKLREACDGIAVE